MFERFDFKAIIGGFFFVVVLQLIVGVLAASLMLFVVDFHEEDVPLWFDIFFQGLMFCVQVAGGYVTAKFSYENNPIFNAVFLGCFMAFSPILFTLIFGMGASSKEVMLALIDMKSVAFTILLIFSYFLGAWLLVKHKKANPNSIL